MKQELTQTIGGLALLSLAVAFSTRAEGQDAKTSEAQERQQAELPAFFATEPTLRAYVEEALEKNPAMQESLARYRAALERTPQVSALPDLMFTFGQAIRSVETRVGPQRNTFVLTQAFPWFGELDLKEQVAMQEALAFFDMYRATEREIIAQVKRAYYELVYVDRALAITREEQSLLEHYEALAQTRYSTGQGLQQSVLKVQAEITRVLSRLDILGQQRASLEARLNTLMDRPPGGTLPPTEPPSVPEVTLDLDTLYELGEENRQELKAAEKRIERSERAIDLADKTDWPDFFVGFGFINVGKRTDAPGVASPPPDNGKNAVSISAGISIPIWRGKYDGAMREASEMLLAERSSYANVRNEMEYSIRDQVVRIETFQDQIRLFEDVLIPQSEQTLRATEAAYETGQLGVLDLLDSERVLLNARLVNARYYSDLLSALTNLERAIGTQFPG